MTLKLKFELSGIQDLCYCKNSPDMALKWQKHGLIMVQLIQYKRVFLYLAWLIFIKNVEVSQAFRSKNIVKIAKTWP